MSKRSFLYQSQSGECEKTLGTFFWLLAEFPGNLDGWTLADSEKLDCLSFEFGGEPPPLTYRAPFEVSLEAGPAQGVPFTVH